jgi:SAM-dependent methyltransferase
MLNLNKEAKALEVGELKVAECPICASVVSHVYFMQDAKTKRQSKWFSCSCGIVWQDSKPTMVYDKKYWDKCNDACNKIRPAFQYPVRLYAPLIEELMYGRKVLQVGCPNPYQSEAFAERGWITYSIDKNQSLPASDRHYVGDFETHDLPENSFNMIWIYHTLECFTDPMAALAKAKRLLTEDGILFIGTPDTDFINTRSSSGFVHWKPDMNHMMWNRRSLTRQLENLGFSVIMARQNYEQRFPVWDDCHIIAQKKFF